MAFHDKPRRLLADWLPEYFIKSRRRLPHPCPPRQARADQAETRQTQDRDKYEDQS